ncbi:hypothetical protein HK103_003429 [Boothiomyces macroporosus]|uniref:Thioesterase domain-containing protein n=1 Tax=Boothiomyces macroporosus TaxID=261099 RepID=A0AAD5Y6D7_9FUNG|nr:hypothetical protein HK103_003429 [Boothiomyces macroporosus]
MEQIRNISVLLFTTAALFSVINPLFKSRSDEHGPVEELTHYNPPPEIKERIKSLPIVKHVENIENIEIRPFVLPNPRQFIRGKMLHKEEGIEIAQSQYSKMDQTVVVFLQLGHSLTGHPGIIHGGLISALFDDIMGEMFYSHTERKYFGFTASLKIDYRKPMESGQVIAFCVKITEQKERKIYIKGAAFNAEENLVFGDGTGMFEKFVGKATLYSEAESLYIIPKDSWEKYKALHQ